MCKYIKIIIILINDRIEEIKIEYNINNIVLIRLKVNVKLDEINKI
jgi:hypothetical protein